MKTITKTAKLALLAMLAVICFACEEKEGKGKLLESIADSNGSLIKKYEYDGQNRIVKIYDLSEKKPPDWLPSGIRPIWQNIHAKISGNPTTIAYNPDGSVKVEENGKIKYYTIKGNLVASEGESFTINKEGYIVKGQSVEYTYKNGNLDVVLWTESAYTDSYQYDSKKSPFSNCNSPKWLMQKLWLDESKNNVVKAIGENGGCKYTYQYDSDGFPTASAKKCYEYEDKPENATLTEIRTYTYYGK